MSARTHEEARAADTQRLRDENEAAREMIRIYREDRAALLDALQTVMRMDVKGHQLQDRLQFSTEGRAILDKARAAIAKAEGR